MRFQHLRRQMCILAESIPVAGTQSQPLPQWLKCKFIHPTSQPPGWTEQINIYKCRAALGCTVAAVVTAVCTWYRVPAPPDITTAKIAFQLGEFIQSRGRLHVTDRAGLHEAMDAGALTILLVGLAVALLQFTKEVVDQLYFFAGVFHVRICDRHPYHEEGSVDCCGQICFPWPADCWCRKLVRGRCECAVNMR